VLIKIEDFLLTKPQIGEIENFRVSIFEKQKIRFFEIKFRFGMAQTCDKRI